jgi:4-carboxymuconolactone decarboxylase
VTHRPLRVPPQPPEAWSEATRAVLGAAPQKGRLHLPAVVARHPTLLEPYMAWATAVARHGVLSRRDNALLALRTALRCGSEFEWGVHVAHGELTPDEVARAGEGPDAGWSARDAALLRAADELHDRTEIGDANWAQLTAMFPTDALLEILFVVGHYTMLSMVANGAGVQPEPDWPGLGEGR